MNGIAAFVGNMTMMRFRNKILLGLVFLTVLTGCREEYKHLTFEPTDVPMQTVEDVNPADHAVTAELTISGEKPGAVPYTYHLLPASEREAVFDMLLGPDRDVFFLQEPGRETLVAFDGQSDEIFRVAQACRIGNEKSSVLILLGMTALPHQPPAIKVYTFEKGRAADDKPYKAGKYTFLEQFRDPQVITRPKEIQGITGATPIWKSVAGQVRNSYELLLKDKASAAWVAGIRDNGKVWHRGADTVDSQASEQEDTATSVARVDSISMDLAGMQSDQNTPESFTFTEEDSLMAASQSEFLYDHWKMVAMAEISLLACGLLIVAATQFKRAVYK